MTFCGTLAPDWSQPLHVGGHPVPLCYWYISDEDRWHRLANQLCSTWGRQGCPLSPTLFGIFFDGLHDYLLAWAPAVGVQLRSGRVVSSLVYADDVVLLSWTSHGLQHLIDGMHQILPQHGPDH